MNGTRIAVDANTVVSGLLFAGNERELLIRGAAGRASLVAGEDTVEEVLRVLSERFSDHPQFAEAMAWLERLLTSFELVPRSAYAARVPALAQAIRDPKDAPVLAAALEAKVDCLVTGDADLLVLGRMEDLAILRTREALLLLRT